MMLIEVAYRFTIAHNFLVHFQNIKWRSSKGWLNIIRRDYTTCECVWQLSNLLPLGLFAQSIVFMILKNMNSKKSCGVFFCCCCLFVYLFSSKCDRFSFHYWKLLHVKWIVICSYGAWKHYTLLSTKEENHKGSEVKKYTLVRVLTRKIFYLTFTRLISWFSLDLKPTEPCLFHPDPLSNDLFCFCFH